MALASPSDLQEQIDSWLAADLPAKEVEMVLKRPEFRTGAFCFRRSASGDLETVVLCVRCRNGTVSQFRVRVTSDKAEMLDVNGDLPPFGSAPGQ